MSGAPRVRVSIYPFGSQAEEMLRSAGCEVLMNPYQRRLRPEEVQGFVRDADAVIAGTEPYSRATLESAEQLKLISRVGVGLDSIDFEAACVRNIVVAYTPDAPTQAVAELTIGLILNLARGIVQAHGSVLKNEWLVHRGTLLQGKTLGILGLGRVGRCVARLATALSMRVIAFDVVVSSPSQDDAALQMVAMEELLSQSDFVSLHVPLTPSTRDLICARTLRLFKPGAFLINTSRGAVVNEEDLYEALRSGQLAGAALDVYRSEPYRGPLASLPNTILTCHMGSATHETRAQMEREAAAAVVDFFAGRQLARVAVAS